MENGENIAILIGIDESLRGNENNITACLPFLRCAEGDRIVAARKLNWNCNSGDGLTSFANEEEARAVGTLLDLKHKISISNDELVVLLGTTFHSNLKVITETALMESIEKSWTSIQNGFHIKCMSAQDYEAFRYELVQKAKEVFDQEITNSSGKDVSKRTEASLEVLEGNSATQMDDYFVRKVVAAKLEGDVDTHRKYLEFASVELDEPKETIESWVRDYMRFLTPTILTTSAEKQVVVTRVALQEQSDDIIQDWISQFIEYVANNTNSDEARERVTYLAQRFVGMQKFGLFNIEDFRSLWWKLQKNPDVNRTAQGKLRLAYLLRARTKEVAKELWSNTVDTDWASVFPIFNYTYDKARRVSKLALEMKRNRLYVGESQFYEDRLFAELLDQVMKQVGGIQVDKVRLRQYGASEADGDWQPDFLLRNEMILEADQRQSEGIFEHRGYFAFVRRDFLEHLAANSASEVVRTVITEKLIPLESDRLGRQKDQTQLDKIETAARCWIAIQGGLSCYLNSEYGGLLKIMKKQAETVRKPTKQINRQGADQFDDDFESFIQGKINVFMGGSVHARLIKGWWMNGSEEIVELLGPEHIRYIRGRNWPLNKLVFSRGLSDNRTKVRELRRELTALYRELAKLISLAAERAKKQDVGARRLIKYFMYILAKEQKSGQRGNLPRWCFVTDEDAMLSLLSDDNSFSSEGQEAV